MANRRRERHHHPHSHHSLHLPSHSRILGARRAKRGAKRGRSRACYTDGRCGTLRFLGGVESCDGRSIGTAFQGAVLISDSAPGETNPSVEDQTQDLTSSPSRQVEKEAVIMHFVAKSCWKQTFRRVITPVSNAKSTSRPFSSFVTGRQFGGLLVASTSARTYVPALIKQSRVTAVFQRWYSIPQLQENVRCVYPISMTENFH